jgi:hypothetical protein
MGRIGGSAATEIEAPIEAVYEVGRRRRGSYPARADGRDYAGKLKTFIEEGGE